MDVKAYAGMRGGCVVASCVYLVLVSSPLGRCRRLGSRDVRHQIRCRSVKSENWEPCLVDSRQGLEISIKRVARPNICICMLNCSCYQKPSDLRKACIRRAKIGLKPPTPKVKAQIARNALRALYILTGCEGKI
jgi:hypothetical protein